MPELPLLTAAERAQVVSEWNRTELAHDRGACVHQLVEAQAARTPEAPAVYFEGRAISYGELNQRANRLARSLRAQGVGAGTRVGVCLARTPELIVSLLAVLKAGAAYVPIDPAYPQARQALMVEEAERGAPAGGARAGGGAGERVVQAPRRRARARRRCRRRACRGAGRRR